MGRFFNDSKVHVRVCISYNLQGWPCKEGHIPSFRQLKVTKIRRSDVILADQNFNQHYYLLFSIVFFLPNDEILTDETFYPTVFRHFIFIQ